LYVVVVSRVLPTQDRSRIALQIWNLYSANKLSMTRRFAVSRSGWTRHLCRASSVFEFDNRDAFAIVSHGSLVGDVGGDVADQFAHPSGHGLALILGARVEPGTKP
jgi:hypothetical protein